MRVYNTPIGLFVKRFTRYSELRVKTEAHVYCVQSPYRSWRMATAAAAGLAVAMAAYAARFAVVGAERMMMQYGAGGAGVRFAQGGFLAEMTKREASQILAVRQSANADRVKAQHKKVRMCQINFLSLCLSVCVCLCVFERERVYWTHTDGALAQQRETNERVSDMI